MVKIPDDLKHHFKVLEIAVDWHNEDELRDFLIF